MSRPIRAFIDTAALISNYRLAKRQAPHSFVWAVIKANAYGHGLERIARALLAEADGFIVAEIDEALNLRSLGIRQPILLVEGCFSVRELSEVVAKRLTIVVHCDEQIKMLDNAPLDSKIPVYCKINSGMNRLGFHYEKTQSAFERLRKHRAVSSITLMSHFAAADENFAADEYCSYEMQSQRFIQLCQQLNWTGPCSFANSAALLRYQESHYQAVRPGIMLYGASPFPLLASAEKIGLLPVMTLQSELIATQLLKAGDRVSYSGTFTAEHEMKLGVVACGYADGYPRHAPIGTPVWVDGQRTRLIGRVTMDMLLVDLAPCPDAGIGSSVILWGKHLSADEVAMAAGTISYELFTSLAQRVKIMAI